MIRFESLGSIALGVVAGCGLRAAIEAAWYRQANNTIGGLFVFIAALVWALVVVLDNDEAKP